MKSCGRAREAMMLLLREQATEAQRLFLDEHLDACLSCREERASVGLLERLRDAPPAGLSGDARSRVLGHLLDTRADVRPKRAVERWRGPLWFALTAVPVAIVAIFIWRAIPGKTLAPTPEVAIASRGPAQEAPVQRMSKAGETQLRGAHFAYLANSAFRVHADHRRVDLVAGEIDVDVTPGGPGHFRVTTPRFTVEVLGTRFMVSLGEARVLRGQVRVLSPDGAVLAMLNAGDSWRLPDSEPASNPSTEVKERPAPAPAMVRAEPSRNAPAPASLQARAERPRSGAAPTPPAVEPESLRPTIAAMPALTGEQKLAEARRALGHGQTQLAREIAAEVLSGANTPRERAMAELVNADAELVDRNPEGALSAYRRTALMYATFPEGELAAFLSGQLLLERGRKEDARVAFQIYLLRYSSGRFARDVREKLGRLGSP